MPVPLALRTEPAATMGSYAPLPSEPGKEGFMAARYSANEALRDRFERAKELQEGGGHAGKSIPEKLDAKHARGKTLDGRPLAQTAREYAYRNLRKHGDAQDMVLWYPSLPLKDGRAEVFFDLAPNAATYRILVNAHTADGRLGFYQGTLEVRPGSPTKPR
jgi:hypothetical protein